MTTTTAEAAILQQFEREQENAKGYLKDLVRSATRAIADIEAGQFQRTDFVSQYAAKYAEVVARQNGLSYALSIVSHYAEAQS